MCRMPLPRPPTGLDTLTHQLPFPSLVLEAMRRVTATKQEAFKLMQILQDNPLANHCQAHQSGTRASQTIFSEMETLEDL